MQTRLSDMQTNAALPMAHMATNAEWRSVLWNSHTTKIATVPPVGRLGICTEEYGIRHYHARSREGFVLGSVTACGSRVQAEIGQKKGQKSSHIFE